MMVRLIRKTLPQFGRLQLFNESRRSTCKRTCMTKCLVTRDYEGEFYQKPFVSTFLQIISWNRFTLLLKIKRQFGKQKSTFFPSNYCFYGTKELTQELNTRKISEIEIAFFALFQHVDFTDFYQKPVWKNEKFNFAEKRFRQINCLVISFSRNFCQNAWCGKRRNSVSLKKYFVKSTI